MRVMICDDEEHVRLVYRAAFEALGVEVTEAVDGDDCLARIVDDCPDLFMPGLDGLSALPELRRRCSTARVLVVSAHDAVDTFARCHERGATACFDKLSFIARIPRIVEHYAAA